MDITLRKIITVYSVGLYGLVLNTLDFVQTRVTAALTLMYVNMFML